ncbi:DinB family protein [Marinobacter nitratireducens]|uniref:DinB family protein n=1 Tax=Marinobacter nitratireducens TaxID=1137280 RepID=A0A072N4L3_9GAMM|nr:DinB family protein [Marinobacter nitratireducens]KEF32624.1 DinB family protein [Marinobacter nitratireducens]
MSLKQHFELMAAYNQWMNEKEYDAAGHLDTSALTEDRGAFFSSILGTLNHIVVGDTIWLKRFATHPASTKALTGVIELPFPTSLDQILFENFSELYSHRKWLDEQIIHWISKLSNNDLDYILSYQNTKGVSANKRFSALILHFFNHQTHHRGQVSTLLSQAGEEVGVTDLLALIPDETRV